MPKKLIVGQQCSNGHTVSEHTIYNRPDGRKRCRLCHKQVQKQRALEKAPEIKAYTRQYLLKRDFGWTVNDYADALKSQKNKCSICKKEQDNLDIDHDHSTNKVRGLLCTNCNIGLGHFKDSTYLLNEAIKYLRR